MCKYIKQFKPFVLPLIGKIYPVCKLIQTINFDNSSQLLKPQKHYKRLYLKGLDNSFDKIVLKSTKPVSETDVGSKLNRSFRRITASVI